MKREELIEILKNSKSKEVYCFIDNLFMGIKEVKTESGNLILVLRDPRIIEKDKKELNN